MELQIFERLSQLAYQFDIGMLIKSEKLKNGLINDSYQIETSRGRFVVQRLSSLWDERVIDDYCEVQRYLRTNGVFVPVLLHDLTGKAFIKNETGLWRVFEYIQHDAISVPSPEIAYEAGAMLGKFHAVMAQSSFKPSFMLPGFHDTPLILRTLQGTSRDSHHTEKSRAVQEELRFISEKLPEYYLPKEHQSIVIHGDPKMNNFLFVNGKVKAILDLDTLMYASPLLDVGDAFRSWCRRKPATSEFMHDIFEGAVQGYNSTAPFRYTIAGMKNAMSLITLELAARYLTDYFKESYFRHEKEKYPSLAEQNLTRCKRYLQYYTNFMAHKEPYVRDE